MTRRYKLFGDAWGHTDGEYVDYSSYYVAITALQQIFEEYSNPAKGHYAAKMVAGVALLSLGENLPKKPNQ